MREDDFMEHPVAIERCPVCNYSADDHMDGRAVVAAAVCAVIVLFVIAGVIIWMASFR